MLSICQKTHRNIVYKSGTVGVINFNIVTRNLLYSWLYPNKCTYDRPVVMKQTKNHNTKIQNNIISCLPIVNNYTDTVLTYKVNIIIII